MKTEYPYLAYWKERGFDKFPTIPPDVILKKNREAFQESLKKNRGIHSRFFLSEEDLKLRDSEIVEMNTPAINEEIATRLRAVMDNAIYEMGLFCFELQKRFMYESLSREDAKQEWANKFLPSMKGGAGLPLQNQRQILKQILPELVSCIKSIRRQLDVPLGATDGRNWPVQESPEDMEKYVPDIRLIFDEKELPLLVEQPSVTKTAINIIHKRLRHIDMNLITPRTLEDLLYKTSL